MNVLSKGPISRIGRNGQPILQDILERLFRLHGDTHQYKPKVYVVEL